MLRSRLHNQATPRHEPRLPRHERGHSPHSVLRSTRWCPANPVAAWLSPSLCVVVVTVTLLLLVVTRFTFELSAVALRLMVHLPENGIPARCTGTAWIKLVCTGV